MRSREVLMVGATLAMAAAEAVAKDRREALTGDQFARMQERAAAAKKAQGKASRKAATQELVVASARQIVLGHIHPRWLRADVEALLDGGQDVTAADIADLRKAGAR